MIYRAVWLTLFTCVLLLPDADDPLHAQTPKVEELRERLRDELLQQREAWQKLEASQHPSLIGNATHVEPNSARYAFSGCMGGELYLTQQDYLAKRSYPRPTRLAHVWGEMGACPFWLPRKVSGRLGRTHEYSGHNPTPAQMVPFSESLIADLSAEAKLQTADLWPISQLVRVLTENEQYDRARHELAGCIVEESWCTLLRLHVEQEAENYRGADSLAKLIMRYSSAETRLSLLDPTLLLWKEDALRYAELRHDSIATNLWWLAQPFFSDSANVRRNEHLSRVVRNTLTQQMELDAFYHTGFGMIGADTKRLMRQKYGWATHNAWVGRAEEKRLADGWKLAPLAPYSAPEYFWPQTAALPGLRAALDPFTVSDDDYSLGPPDSVTYFRWWPAEFFKHRDGLILPFATQQRVFLRRDSSMLVYVATELRGSKKATLIDSIGDLPVRGELWFSPAPDSAWRVFHTYSKLGETLVLHGELSAPGIVGAEYRVNAQGLAGGRSRFGVAELRTLASMPAGTCELSVPMLVDADMLSTNSMTLDKALSGSLTFHKATQLGIAWESYGFTPGDTTTISVHLERITEVGRLRRAGIALGVVNDPSVSASVRWTESDPSRSSISFGAMIPVTQRHLTVGVDKLKAGAYLLQIEMQSARCGAVRSEQEIMLI